ncbi:35106_t:CDS:1, partial [Racocetra persica]
FKVKADENMDAFCLLTILVNKKSLDLTWVFEFKLNNENRLI